MVDLRQDLLVVSALLCVKDMGLLFVRSISYVTVISEVSAVISG